MDDTATSQDASTSFENAPIRRTKLSSLKMYLIYTAVGILFVVTAMTFAIIFTGLHRHNDQLTKTTTSKKPKQCVNKIETNRGMKVSHLYPFIASLISDKPPLFLCICTILTERYLITSANCFSTSFLYLMIRTGSVNWDKGGFLYDVDKFIIHNDYKSANINNNIALLHTKQVLVLSSNVIPVTLEKFDKFEYNAVIVGWACDSYLKQQDVTIWNSSSCSTYTKQNLEYVCASSGDSCKLDFPGLLIVKDYPIGFWTHGLLCKLQPALFINFTYHKKWIDNITNSESN